MGQTTEAEISLEKAKEALNTSDLTLSENLFTLLWLFEEVYWDAVMIMF